MIRFRDGFYADVRTEDRFTTNISYKGGVPENATERVEKRAFIRVYDGRLWYYASVTDLDDLQSVLDGLYSAATPDANIGSDPVVKRFEREKASLSEFADCSVRNVSLEEKKKLLLSYLPLLDSDPCITFSSGVYLDRNSAFGFRSSLGADITYDYQTCGIVLGFNMAENDKKFSGHWQKGCTRFEDLKGLDSQIESAVKEQTYFLRNSVAVVAGNYPVVLSPEAAGVFAHESFGHKSESDFMLSDESMREAWQLGKKVGSSILSIVDCGEIKGSGFVPYDDEGSKARKNYLVKNGVLTGRLHNAQTATALDEGLTGNARALDCTFEPIVRMTTTYIEGGDLDFDQLIAPIKQGYYVKSIKHGSGMSSFTLAPSLAYEIIDGKLGRPVQISVLTGSVFETLGLIDGLTREVEYLSFVAGGCGKMEQQGLPVGFGGPYVRVSSINVQ